MTTELVRQGKEQAVFAIFERYPIVHTDLIRLEAKRRSKIPEILIVFTHWVHSFKGSDSSLQMKLLISHPGNTATYGSDLSSSQTYGHSHKISDVGKLNVE
jgi:hypothetical protein